MSKRLFFSAVVLSLVLVGGANAHKQTMHQHITREAFKLLQMSFPGKSPEAVACVGNLVFNRFVNDPFSKQFDYQDGNYSNCYMQNSNSLPVENNSNSTIKRPLKFSKICKQIVIGEISGLGCSFVGMCIFPAFAPHDESMGTLAYVYIGWYAGYMLGNSIGVYIAGNDKYEKGSYFATLGGSILGALIGVSTFFALDNKDIGACLSIISPPIGSILGFNLSRKPRGMAHGRALINWGQGGLKWSLSNINVYFDNCNRPVLNVNLFQANF